MVGRKGDAAALLFRVKAERLLRGRRGESRRNEKRRASQQASHSRPAIYSTGTYVYKHKDPGEEAEGGEDEVLVVVLEAEDDGHHDRKLGEGP